MAQLELSQIGFSYGSMNLEGISFCVAKGSVTALVGASGSGKTTILKLIAGFLTPSHGHVSIAGEKVATKGFLTPPHLRKIGLVFQNHALLPHLTVEANIQFGATGKSGKARCLELMSELHIDRLAKHYPHQISGGEAQRVALARAMMAEPNILLMDEPFASIDNVLRRKVRQDTTRILRGFGITALIVTHDAEEALELADQIIVIDQGKILQIGTPFEIYTHPASLKVAALFGEVNHITDPALVKALGGAGEMLIRPMNIAICDDGSGDKSGVQATITNAQFRGNHYVIELKTKTGQTVLAHAQGFAHTLGDVVYFKAG